MSNTDKQPFKPYGREEMRQMVEAARREGRESKEPIPKITEADPLMHPDLLAKIKAAGLPPPEDD